MFSTFGDVLGTDVDDGATDGFGGHDHDVVVLGDLEGVEGFVSLWDVEDSGVDGVEDGVVDEFGEDETIYEESVFS